MEDDEVPPFVEFNQQHYMNDNNDDDCDDDLLSIAADDEQQHFGEPSVAHHKEEDVTKQDLNAMKQMINDMLLNPELLHQSPVYSKTVISCQDDSREEAMATTSQAAAASIPTPKNTIESTSVSYSTSRRQTTQSSSTTTAWPISRRTTQSSMSFCQECSDGGSPAEVSKLSVAATRYPSRSGQKSTEQQAINFKRVVSQAPPLPFSRNSRAA